jgi:toxin ParE1/3/4
MVEYKLTNKAVEDLNDIWEYTIEKWAEEQADKYYNLLLNSFQEIANNPELGKNYQGIKKELFGLKTNKHIIFYRKSGDKPLEITRILHGRMDLKNRINE